MKVVCFSFKLNLKKRYKIIQFLHVFQPSFGDNSAICWSILMQDTVLERLLVVDLTKLTVNQIEQFIIFSRNRKTVKKKFCNRHASKQTSFSYSIFRGFLQNMHQNIRKGSYFMNSSSSGEYLIFFCVLCLCLLLTLIYLFIYLIRIIHPTLDNEALLIVAD